MSSNVGLDPRHNDRVPTPAQTDADLAQRAREIFALQQANRWTVAATTAAQRIEWLRRLKSAIEDRRSALAAAMHADFRKHPAEVDLTEIHPALEEINHAIRHLEGWMKPVRVKTPLLLAGTRAELRYEPKGVVLILAPWNYPFGLLINPLVAAVAAGNCAILRPSEKVPHTARFLGQLVAEVFPEDVVALVAGGTDVADALLELPFDHIFFTGSTRIGRKVMAAAARHLASVTLELGGKSPAVVDETADLRAAARRVVWGKFINAGQTCVAPDYVYVHASREREFVEAAKAALAEFYGATEEEREKSADFPRLVDDAAFARVRSLVEESVAAGARIVAGGRFDPSQRYAAPTLLTGVEPGSPAMAEEIFGPVLPVLTYTDLDDVVEHIRSGAKPLALYIFSRRNAAVESLLARTSAGGTCVNNTVVHLANPYLPFGGVGESGQGSYHGWFGFRTFSHERSVLVQRQRSLVDFFYPPYGTRVKEIASRLVRALE